MKFLSKYLFLLFLLISFSSKAQVNLDSLWVVWNDSTQADTNRLKAMNQIVKDGYLFSQPDSAFYFAQSIYVLAKLKHDDKWIASALNLQGISSSVKGDLQNAIKYFDDAVKYHKKLNDTTSIITVYGNLSIIYRQIKQL